MIIGSENILPVLKIAVSRSGQPLDTLAPALFHTRIITYVFHFVNRKITKNYKNIYTFLQADFSTCKK